MLSNQISPNGQPTKRIEYIDALRGFTMTLVVMLHVVAYCLPIQDNDHQIYKYLQQVRMPMFFFISGFVFFKASVVWDTKQVISFFRKKIPVQLLSPLLFFVLFAYTKGLSIVDNLFESSKLGYWFTYALFFYYVFYISIKFCIRNKYADIILLLIGSFLYVIIHPTIYTAIPLSDEMKGLLSISEWNFFIFFVLGTLARKHFDQFERILDHTPLLAICILTFFLVNGFMDLIPISNRIIPRFLCFPAVIVCFSFFRLKQSIFTKDKLFGRTMQYIGRRTLDIYLIHWFLQPRELKHVLTVFQDYSMPVIEGTLTLLIAIIIIAASLLIGNIIRLSPFLAHWVFGAKYPTNK